MSSNRRLKAARVGQLTEPQSPRLQEEPEDGGVPPFGEAATLADLEQQPQSQVIHRNDGDRDLGDGRRVHPGHRAGHDDLFLRRPAVALLQPRNLVAAVDGVSRSSTLSRAERVRLHIGLGQGEDILPVVEGGKLIERFPVALDRLGLRARCRRVRSEPPGRVELPTCSLRVVRGGVREGPSWCVVAAQRGYADSDRHRRIRVDDADWPPRWHHRKTPELAPLSEKGEITSALVVTRSDGYLHFPGNPDAFTELVNAVSAETPRSGCLWVEPLTCTPSR